MRVTHLSLGNFRNYKLAEVPFEAGLNLILGRNGQGKTNIVEAIGYFSSLGSHRVSSDSAMIRSEQESATMRMRVAVKDREVLLETQLNRHARNRAQVNRGGVAPRELTRWFSSVLFAPEDLQLVKGDPAGRRRFLDLAVSSRQPAFAATLSDYDRVVKQRSALLKSARYGSDRGAAATLEVWDARLIELGVAVMQARRSLIQAIETPLRGAYGAIVEQDHLPRVILLESISAGEQNDVSRETLESNFREALVRVRSQELERGMSLVGPHRDDALFELNSLPVKGYASHGESWSFALSIRLAMAQLLQEESPSGDPVIILDDVFAELDARRRRALMTAVSKFEQVIVTAAVASDVPEAAWNPIRVNAGTIVSEGAADNDHSTLEE